MAAALMSPRPAWNSQGSLNCPVISINALSDDCSTQASLLTPCRKSLSQSIVSQEPIARSVSLLFILRRPRDIAQLIIAVIVDASKRVRRSGSISDILQEHLKGFPPQADCDSTASILRVAIHRRVFAAAVHSIPSHPLFSCVRVLLRPRVSLVHDAIIAGGGNFGCR